jgi:hypothetical protein
MSDLGWLTVGMFVAFWLINPVPKAFLLKEIRRLEERIEYLEDRD